MSQLKPTLCILLCLALTACATLGERGIAVMEKKGIVKEASYAIPPDTDTALHRVLSASIRKNDGKSGFRVYDRGEDSLYARMALMQMAEKSLDLQYYAVADDITSNLMVEGLIMAAERGVRVRLLIDGFTIAGMADSLTAFDGIKNIDVRVFNPVGFSDEDPFSKLSGMVSNAPQVNRRMHNKAIISDNQIAMIGGRNLGDEYFDADAEVSFKDIDILAAGSITQQISKSFDDYWNDDSAYPLEAVYHPANAKNADNIRRELKDNWNKRVLDPKWAFSYQRSVEDMIHDKRVELIWAPAKFVADDPLKVQPVADDKNSEPLDELLNVANRAQKELIFVSSYFVPLERGMGWLAQTRQKGIAVRILTNSLASTDVVAVHSGYESSRQSLLKQGIELYELRPLNERSTKQRLLARSAPPRAGLHAKVYIVDRRYTLTGSFNLDPRSVDLNTETMLLIDSPQISQALAAGFERAIDPGNSYKLALDPTNGALVWISREDGQMHTEHFEPEAGIGRRFQNFLFSLLPIKRNL